MNEHLAALQTWIGEEGLDLAYISDPININYYTGFFQDPEERITALIVAPDHDPFLFTPQLTIEEVKKPAGPTRYSVILITRTRLQNWRVILKPSTPIRQNGQSKKIISPFSNLKRS